MLIPTKKHFSFMGDLSVLVAKEWVELRRGGAMGPVLTGYISPLFAIYFIVWFLGSGLGIPVSFNVVFYGSFVGFLGVTIYSWITNLESNDFLDSQPVGVHQVVKAKLIVYFQVTLLVSSCYVCIIGFAKGEVNLLPLALLASTSNMVYIAAVISRLTGLWTNTMLFDAKVLSKFTGAVVPPLVAVLFASLTLNDYPSLSTLIIGLVSIITLVSSLMILRSLSTRWKRASFSLTSKIL
jgi:hypothetical protein